jgi:hypothetical protein
LPKALWLIGVLIALGDPLAASVAPAMTQTVPWLQISERTACEAMQEAYCAGRFGFTIRQDGSFVAGEFGAGRTVEGKIAPEELQQLSLLIREASPGATGGEQTCRKGGLPGVKDQVDLTLTGGAVVRIYDLGSRVGHVCHVGNWHRVRRLHDHLRSLMSRYYPVPFPTH